MIFSLFKHLGIILIISNYYDNYWNTPINATTEEIKQHYRKYVKIHHPDKGGKQRKI